MGDLQAVTTNRNSYRIIWRGSQGEISKKSGDHSRPTTKGIRHGVLLKNISQGSGRVEKNPSDHWHKEEVGATSLGMDTPFTRVDPKTYGHLTTRGVATHPFYPGG